MEIRRYCGHERLPGGERRWRRLARAVGFNGRLEVYGYGVSGRPGIEQRREMRGVLPDEGVTVADYSSNVIRVWLPCQCAAAEFDRDDLAKEARDPLTNFAHELGHHVADKKARKYIFWIEEMVVQRYGRWLLRRVA